MLGTHNGDLLLHQFLFERGPESAGGFDFLELRPGRSTEFAGDVFDGASAGGRIADLRQIALLEQNELRIACDPAGKSIGQAERRGMRDCRDAVGAAQARRRDRERHAQHVHVGITLGHHAPRRFGGDISWFRRQSASRFDAGPEFPDRAELGDGDEFVGVSREAEVDHVARFIERHAGGFERAQIFNGAGDSKRQFLRLRAAGIVNDAAVGDSKRTLEALTG